MGISTLSRAMPLFLQDLSRSYAEHLLGDLSHMVPLIAGDDRKCSFILGKFVTSQKSELLRLMDNVLASGMVPVLPTCKISF